MPVRSFSDSEITKLKQIINEGIQVTAEVEITITQHSTNRPCEIKKSINLP